jgi:Ni,Fe-hydrogenase III large subunit
MQSTPTLAETVAKGRAVRGHRPWPRTVVDEDAWRSIAAKVAAGAWTLLDLWGDAGAVHMALLDEGEATVAVISLECRDGRFPSVAKLHPPAIRLERTIVDLYGLEAEGAPDPRPWLDHGKWRLRHPLGTAKPAHARPVPYPFLPTEGESLHRIPVGPVHAGIIEPGHFRFTANGETVVRLEQRLGYVHKGIDSLMAGASLRDAARLAGHVSGDSTVGYALAFARAVEAALDIEAPPRSAWLRALALELERIANHFGDIGAICNDASFSLMHAHCGILRERVLRATEACFGHRLAMDCIIPGGMAVDLGGDGATVLRRLVDEAGTQFAKLVELYDNTASLQNRTVGTGILKPSLASQYGCGGYIGRASGRGHDARRLPGYPPYPSLRLEIPVLGSGDVDARVRIRIREVLQSLGLIEQILGQLPDGPVHAPVDMQSAGGEQEGMALVEGFRGDILAWVRLADHGRVARCHLRDPSWFQWPLLEAAIEGNIVADFPLCNKSFNCSYSGHDL